MYNIKSVAKLLEMPAVTIRAWERRYNVVTPKRSESGHRLYTEQDIEDLRWLKLQTEEKGMNISQAVKMLQKRREEREVVPREASTPDETFSRMQENLFEALMRFDSEKANSILGLGFSMFHYEDIFHRVLAPLLHQVGDLWEQGEVTVAQEHFASNYVSQRFFQFFQVFTTNPSLPKVVALCPEGEQHQIGLLLFSLFLRRMGFEVIYLGTNTPHEGLPAIIGTHHAQIVAISLTTSDLMPRVVKLVQELHEQFPKIRFALGGQGFTTVPEEIEPWVLGGDIEIWKNWYAETSGHG